MWFQVEDTALGDPRIRLVAARLGIPKGDAFLACCRVWCWLYQRGSDDPLPQEEVDVVAEEPGFADALIGAGLATVAPEGVRIAGGWRAKKYGQFREWQKQKSAAGVAARKGEIVMAETNDDPRVHPRMAQGGSLVSLDLDLSQVLESPERDPARAKQAERRAAAQLAAEAWVEWFNRRFARSFRVTQELSKLVGALLAKGFTEKPDMRGVALYLRSRWEDDERMAPHLVPSTILRPTKFAERLDLAREWDPGIWVQS